MKPWIPIFNPVIHYQSLENLLNMTKFLFILMVIYFLYYAGNMVYDLFLKKESPLVTEEIDVFSLVEFEAQNKDEVTTVGIEDVENLKTPNSFNRREFPINTEMSEDREDIDVWRERFESEQEMDSFHYGSVKTEIDNKMAEGLIDTRNSKPPLLQSENTEDDAHQIRIKANEKRWRQLWNDAETTVQMISNTNGHKVYQALI